VAKNMATIRLELIENSDINYRNVVRKFFYDKYLDNYREQDVCSCWQVFHCGFTISSMSNIRGFK